jgi:hypothetical protein
MKESSEKKDPTKKKFSNITTARFNDIISPLLVGGSTIVV